MAKEKSVKGVSEEEFAKFSELMSKLQGHYLSLTVSSTKEGEKDWKATGKVQVGSTLDGEHWGEMNMAVKGWDVNSDSAIATVMVSINNYINSPEFIVEMGNKLVKALDEDANYPAILVE